MSARSTPQPGRKWKASVPSLSERRALKRMALLQEAGKAFSRGGFSHTSMDDVARALGVSKPTLYYYFDSKHDILYECHKVALDFGDLARAEAEAHEGSALEKLHTFFVRYVGLLTSEAGICAVLTEYYALLPEDEARIQKRRRDFDRFLRKLISQGIEDGSIAPCDPKLAVTLIMGFVNALHSWYSPDGELTGTEIAEELMRYMCAGLKPRH